MRLSKLTIRDHPILKDMDLDFRDKEGNRYPVVAFVGENGCGKTTLLGELFDYSKSEFVVDKEKSNSSMGEKGFQALFLRQDSLYTKAMNDIYKLITDKVLMKSSDEDSEEGQNAFGLKRDISAVNMLDAFNDERLKELFVSGDCAKISGGGEVSRSINGVKQELDFTMLSSGETEILLKLETLKQLKIGTDMVLLDEPETSLHPRWQKVVIDVLLSMIREEGGQAPQLFVATHSERVLESLLERGDCLIIRLYREREKILAKPIDLMGLLLPKPTFAELDYVIFGMPSYDYHNQLFARYCVLKGISRMLTVDRNIMDSPLFDAEKCKKRWEKPGNHKQVYETLPLYIRNWFHHPSEKHDRPTQKELETSNIFMRELIAFEMR